MPSTTVSSASAHKPSLPPKDNQSEPSNPSEPSPRATHPNLPQGQPILTFPKGRNKLLCFVKDFSKSILPMNISPHLTSPEGEGQLLLLLIND